MDNQNPKILGVITARGGSKTMPGKNIKLLGSKPLIAYSIEAVKKSKLITHLIISTDSQEIADIAKQYGCDVPFLRPAELAQDDTKHLPVMQHAVKTMEEKLGFQFDYVVTLQPTSPFRTKEDIDKTLELLIEAKADSAVTMVEIDSDYHPLVMKKMEGDKVLPYCMEEPEGTRRQDFPKVYKRSSAVYAHRRDVLIEKNRFYGDDIRGILTPQERYIDIDNLEDWQKAEQMLEELKAKGYQF